MPHCSPEQLALAALGEPLPDDDATHLAGCAHCRAEVAALRRPVEVLATPPLTGPVDEVAPPPSVWQAVAAATGVSTTPRAQGSSPGDVVPLRPRRTWQRWLPLAAAVLVGGVLGAGITVLSRGDGGSVIASTSLAPLADAQASGRAAVRESDGRRSLQVDLTAPPLRDGYYEVWVMQPDAVRMMPVGVVRDGDTVLPLPDDLDLRAYPLVDVSVEPMDGDPTHSGLSVARGSLP